MQGEKRQKLHSAKIFRWFRRFVPFHWGGALSLHFLRTSYFWCHMDTSRTVSSSYNKVFLLIGLGREMASTATRSESFHPVSLVILLLLGRKCTVRHEEDKKGKKRGNPAGLLLSASVVSVSVCWLAGSLNSADRFELYLLKVRLTGHEISFCGTHCASCWNI